MTFDFMQAKEVLLRSWDESMNTQPAAITWNLMGMMNNCYFRCGRAGPRGCAPAVPAPP